MILPDFCFIRFSYSSNKLEDDAKTLGTSRYIHIYIYEHSEIKDFWKKRGVILSFSFFLQFIKCKRMQAGFAVAEETKKNRSYILKTDIYKFTLNFLALRKRSTTWELVCISPSLTGYQVIWIPLRLDINPTHNQFYWWSIPLDASPTKHYKCVPT
jgi:hypothetical protein